MLVVWCRFVKKTGLSAAVHGSLKCTECLATHQISEITRRHGWFSPRICSKNVGQNSFISCLDFKLRYAGVLKALWLVTPMVFSDVDNHLTLHGVPFLANLFLNALFRRESVMTEYSIFQHYLNMYRCVYWNHSFLYIFHLCILLWFASRIAFRLTWLLFLFPTAIYVVQTRLNRMYYEQSY